MLRLVQLRWGLPDKKLTPAQPSNQRQAQVAVKGLHIDTTCDLHLQRAVKLENVHIWESHKHAHNVPTHTHVQNL